MHPTCGVTQWAISAPGGGELDSSTLLHRHTLGQVARHIDVESLAHRHMIGQHLHGQHAEEGLSSYGKISESTLVQSKKVPYLCSCETAISETAVSQLKDKAHEIF